MNRIFILFLFCAFAMPELWGQPRGAVRDFSRAQEHVANQEFAAAIDDLEDALEDAPDYMDARLFLADIYQKIGKKDSAAAVYERGLAHQPPYYFYLFYGRTLFDLSRYAEAEEMLSHYLKHPRANSRYRNEAEQLVASARFAAKAVAQPKEYHPENLGPKVNSDQMEYFPSISADGLTLVFTHRKMEGEKLDEDFWVSTRDSLSGEWKKAERLRGQLNSPGNEGAQSLTSDGQVIFFAACERQDGFGSCDIFASFKQPDGSWGKAANLGPQINTGLWESQPSISSDGRTLYFVRGRNSVDKNLDLYFSRFTNQGWTKARKVPGKVNTKGQETSPYIHFDNQHLYFSSNGHPGMGDLDFFVSTRQPDGSWGSPRNLGHPINTPAQEFSLIVAPDGQTGYFSSDALETGLGRLDLYSFELPKDSRANRVAYLRGKVIDQASREPLRANIQFSALDSAGLPFERSSGSDGTFYAVVPSETAYALSIEKTGYLFHSERFELTKENEEKAKFLQIELVPIQEGSSVRLENIYFDYDAYDLDSRSTAELNTILRFLEQNPSVEITLEGHTDNQGGTEYNKALSEKRAKAVYHHLAEKGIDTERMNYVGYGASKPISTNDSEEGRAKNRRTEMRIRAYSKK